MRREIPTGLHKKVISLGSRARPPESLSSEHEKSPAKQDLAGTHRVLTFGGRHCTWRCLFAQVRHRAVPQRVRGLRYHERPNCMLPHPDAGKSHATSPEGGQIACYLMMAPSLRSG